VSFRTKPPSTGALPGGGHRRARETVELRQEKAPRASSQRPQQSTDRTPPLLIGARFQVFGVRWGAFAASAFSIVLLHTPSSIGQAPPKSGEQENSGRQRRARVENQRLESTRNHRSNAAFQLRPASTQGTRSVRGRRGALGVRGSRWFRRFSGSGAPLHASRVECSTLIPKGAPGSPPPVQSDSAVR